MWPVGIGRIGSSPIYLIHLVDGPGKGIGDPTCQLSMLFIQNGLQSVCFPLSKKELFLQQWIHQHMSMIAVIDKIIHTLEVCLHIKT